MQACQEQRCDDDEAAVHVLAAATRNRGTGTGGMPGPAICQERPKYRGRGAQGQCSRSAPSESSRGCMVRSLAPPDESRRRHGWRWRDRWSARPGPRRLRFRLHAVFDDFAVERAAADVEDARRLLLVPVHALEDAGDVGAFGFGQRRQALARAHRPGASPACRKSTSTGRMTRPGDDSAARETVLSSSRMLPGQ